MMQWYFAYGSNLLMDQMVRRIGTFNQTQCRVARLESYRLVFQSLAIGEPAWANIVTPGPGVIGVLYRVSSEALATLDRYESGYERQTVNVIDDRGERIDAIAYVMPQSSVSLLGVPSAEYHAKIVTGAMEHGLPESYIRDLRDLSHSIN